MKKGLRLDGQVKHKFFNKKFYQFEPNFNKIPNSCILNIQGVSLRKMVISPGDKQIWFDGNLFIMVLIETTDTSYRELQVSKT